MHSEHKRRDWSACDCSKFVNVESTPLKSTPEVVEVEGADVVVMSTLPPTESILPVALLAM